MTQSIRRVFALVPALVLVALVAPAQLQLPVDGPSMPPPANTLVTLELSAGSEYASEARGLAVMTIAPGWHINSATPKDKFAIPTTLRIDSPDVELVSAEFPPHIERAFTFSGGTKLAVYEGRVEVPFVARKRVPDAAARFVLRYQACDDRVCLPPVEIDSVLQLGRGGTVAQPSGKTPSPSTTGGFTPLSEAPPSSGLFSSDVAATLASRGVLVALLAIFVLGLVLNLTPCVLPLIPITIAYFAAQAEGRRSRRYVLSGAYVLGLAGMYSALGVFAAASGRLFGGWLQQPAVLIVFAGLMIVLSLSMFGLYEIRPPHFITDRAGARAGVAGAFIMGLFAGIVAAPCVGPVVISLVAFVGQTGNTVLGFWLFFVLALGLGAPYFVLGGSVPRSGAWMVQIKKALGFVLIAMAFYFLRPLIGDELYTWGVAASLVAGAGFLIGQSAKDRTANIIRAGLALVLLVAGLWFVPLWRRGSESGIQWARYDEAAIASARAAGQPVIIDFYADWCLPCKELDLTTFSNPAVVTDSTRFTRLKADLTKSEDAATQRLTRRYRIVGVPTIVFLDSSGNEVVAARLTGFESADRFLKRMQKIR